MKIDCKILVGKSEETRLLGRHRRRCEDCTEMTVKKDAKIWTRFLWLRIGSSGGLF
jgi:hypothetical protein